MKAKEDILINYGKAYEYHHSTVVCPLKAAHDAMDEYAKQVAIAFDDWTAYNHVKYQKGGTWVCAGKVYEQPPTTEQLYNQFFESQNKGQ